MDNFDVDQDFNALSEQEKIDLAAQIYGFRSVPPTIDEFIEDDYYVGKVFGGKVYPYWREKLREVFPNPIVSPYRYVVATGAIGTGKSTFSIISALYDYCRMFFLEDAYKSFNLTSNTLFTVRAFNLTKAKADDILVLPMKEIIAQSPFLRECATRIENGTQTPLKISIMPAKKADDVISECLIFSLVSEVNFMKDSTADEIISTCENRMASRLKMVERAFGRIYLDSSSTLDDSPVNRFLKAYPKPEEILILNTRLWEAKKHQGQYFALGSFNVYAGSDGIKPHIIQDGEDTREFDPDRIINVPEELRVSFVQNIEQALNDQAGISINGQNDFFTNKDIITECGTEPEMTDPVIELDFYDNLQLHDVLGEKILSVLPEDKKFYGSIDMGITTDKCGIAIAYLDSANFIDVGGKRVMDPIIKVPIAFAVSRPQGQETSIEKITNFWIWLSTKRQVAMVTTDQYQSTHTRQQLTLHNIESKMQSTVRNDTAYVEFKKLMLRKHVSYPGSNIIKNELWNLQRVSDTFIDHKKTSTKDVCDAMTSAVLAIITDGTASAEPAVNVTVQDYSKIISDLAEKNKAKMYRASLLGWR